MGKLNRRHAMLLATMVAATIGVASIVNSQAVAPSQTKSSAIIRQSFTASVREASQSTVRIKVKDAGDSKQAALGTVVSADGWILTKGTEIFGHSKVLVVLPVRN